MLIAHPDAAWSSRIPSPSQGVWHLGPVPIRGYALSHHPRHRRRHLDRRAALGRPRRPARRGRRPRGLGGAVRPRRRPALPRDHRPRPLLRRGQAPDRGALRLARRPRHLGGDRARRGRRRHRRPPSGHQAAADGSTRWRPACSSPRRSAGGATGSTRSSSAGRPTCRGAWRSTPSTGRRATWTTRRSTRRSSTSSSGAWRRSAVIWADRRFQLGHGRVLALYVMGYTLGRGWIEMLRIDAVELNDVLGLRLNVWTSIVLFVLAAAYFVCAGRRGYTPRAVGVRRRRAQRLSTTRHRFVCGLA